jgi:hypothetical protein
MTTARPSEQCAHTDKHQSRRFRDDNAKPRIRDRAATDAPNNLLPYVDCLIAAGQQQVQLRRYIKDKISAFVR